MYAVGFEPMHGHLVLQSRDPALVWIGKSALEQLRGTSSYGASKEAQQLQQALALSKVEYETHDEVARAAFLLRVPEEPAARAEARPRPRQHHDAAAAPPRHRRPAR